MKELKKLKLKDIVKTPLDVSEMGNLIAGIDDGIMPAAYGCYVEACTSSKTEGESKCIDVYSICESHACYRGA